jgi:WD repeat-containing protein 26
MQLVRDGRLEELVTQSLQHQTDTLCNYHNTNDEHLSLFEDHVCTHTNALPNVTIAVLTDHCDDEVWCVSFAPNGKKLATASANGTVIFYSVNDSDIQAETKLQGIECPNAISWHYNSTALLVCGASTTVK